MNERQRPQPPIMLRMILPLVLFGLYIPLIVMAIGSFFQSLQSGDLTLTLHWYREVFADPILLESLGRSFTVSIAAASSATILGLTGALALDRWNFWGRAPLRALSLLSLMLPELVLALSLLSWFALLGLHLSLLTVIAAQVTLTLPFVVLVVGARMKALEPAFDDAARDLGAKEAQILFRVTLPLLKPAILTAFILAFLLSFDDFLVTYYTNGAGNDTLPVRLYSLMKTGVTPKVQALSSLMLIASIALVALLVKMRGVEDVAH